MVYTTESYIAKATLIHNNFYDYSKVIYTHSYDKILIICPLHGEFEQTAKVHLEKKGCKKCANIVISKKNKNNSKEYFDKVILIHSNKYDYSKSIYTTLSKKIIIICPKHGEFQKRADSHLNGIGCHKCTYDRISGINHHKWNHNKTKTDRLKSRKLAEGINWRKNIYERDNYTCQKCNERCISLHVHHIYPWYSHPNLRFNVDNGITLCVKCHKKYHSQFTKSNCNLETLNLFLMSDIEIEKQWEEFKINNPNIVIPYWI
jgi:hypothetical protein